MVMGSLRKAGDESKDLSRTKRETKREPHGKMAEMQRRKRMRSSPPNEKASSGNFSSADLTDPCTNLKRN